MRPKQNTWSQDGRRDTTITLYPTLNVGNRNYKRTKRFKFLGSVLSEKNEIEIEMTSRLQSEDKCLLVLQNVMNHDRCQRRWKKQLYTTLLRLVITYGAETLLVKEK